MWVPGNHLPNFISLPKKKKNQKHGLETLYSFSRAHKTQSPSLSSWIDLISWRSCLSLVLLSVPGSAQSPRAAAAHGIWDYCIKTRLVWLGWQQGQGRVRPRDTNRVSLPVLIDDPEICGSHLQLEFLVPYDLFLAIYFRPIFMCSVKRCSVASAIGDQITLCLGKWPLELAKESLDFSEPSGALF